MSCQLKGCFIGCIFFLFLHLLLCYRACYLFVYQSVKVWIYYSIIKKSFCIVIGRDYHSGFACLDLSGHKLQWVNSVKYLGIVIVSGPTFSINSYIRDEKVAETPRDASYCLEMLLRHHNFVKYHVVNVHVILYTLYYIFSLFQQN